MLPYKEYEKQVYDWLMSKNQKNPNFTFSVRRNGTKGAKLDYFIGTEKSKYFGFTLWSISVGFPGSSGDCIDVLFKYDNDDFKYNIEFTQTNSPHNEQNTSALNLLKSLKEPITNKLGLSYESSAENKMFTLIPKTPKEKYDSLQEMLEDVDQDLDVVIPLVNQYIEIEKEKNPNFKAHRFTQDEFSKMQKSMLKRFKKYSDIKEGENNLTFEIILSYFNKIDINTYFSFLNEILQRFKLEKGDKRLVFSIANGSLNFEIGQRYCWNLIKSNPKGRFGVISKEKLFPESESFTGKSKNHFYNYYHEIKFSTNEKESIFDALSDQLEITNKSSFYKHNNIDFENYVFNNTTPLKRMNFPLNQILYGPPGTGKTYNTIVKAAEIIENRKIDDFSEAKAIFNKHLGDRIEFITFHQNYSYEDFIQGLRPDVDNDTSLTFDRKDGIFKMISDRALENLYLSEKAPEEVSNDALFDNALENFIEKVQDSEDGFHINDSVAYITEVLDNSFRYKGPNWGHSSLMKFRDLKELYRNDVKSRKDIKKLTSISGLAIQHASYILRVYNEIFKLLPKKETEITKTKIERKNYVIIIDEINRANISRVFGELITLIESDKRSHGAIPLKATLPSGEEFIVPSNLYIIGTMNTADKSIALLDIALRRRFEFVAMYPKYSIDDHKIYDVDILEKINKKIIEKKGHDFQIGHSYFMGDNKDLLNRMNVKVIPLLLEYFMNDEKEVKEILNNANLEIEPDSWPLRIIRKRDQPI